MLFHSGLWTSEAVSGGHPDKACDQISDAILDAFLRADPEARVACETFAADHKIIVAGEFRIRDKVRFHVLEQSAESLVRSTLRAIGYGSSQFDIDPETCEIEIRFNHQSPQIGSAVDGQEGILGAGDQGMMFGYATDETDELMPLSWSLANRMLLTGRAVSAKEGFELRADAKSQITVAYRDGEPVGITGAVLSWQHHPRYEIEAVQSFFLEQVIDSVIPHTIRTSDFKAWINPAGSWTIGGPKGDTGLTGRKIVVDTYGGACPHGGGAFSGKDPTKVDRSGAYMARYIAKHIVAGGYARKCTVQLAYAIGVSEPVSVGLDLHSTGKVPEDSLINAIRSVFDLTPAGIITALHLRQPFYQTTSVYGHFGNPQYAHQHPWEALTCLSALQSELGVMA